MTILGICGPIAGGKSTLAEMITSIDQEHTLHLETSSLVVELANTMNNTIRTQDIRLTPGTDIVAIGNELITSLLPQLSIMAGEEISLDVVKIQPEDMAQHPEWYEKLFVYLNQAEQIPSITHNEISAETKNNYRPLLQWIGGYFLYKLNNRLLWYEELLRRANAAGDTITLVVLTAPRQPAEAEYLQQAGGKVIKITRPGLVSDTSDVTERMVDAIKPDTMVINNGSLKDLQKVASHIRDDALGGALKAEYKAR